MNGLDYRDTRHAGRCLIVFGNSIKIVYNSNSDTTLWLIMLLSLFQMHLHVTYQGLAAAATDSNRSVPSIHGKKLGLSYNPFHG